MKRQDIVAMLRKESLPKTLEHIILAHHDDLTDIRQAMREMSTAFDRLVNLVNMMAKVNSGIASQQDALSKKMGLHATVESVDVNHKDGLEGL